MSTMDRIPSDYEVPATDDFETVPDGQYTAEKVEFFTVDETTKRPMLVSQGDGRMVARARVHTSEGVEPPISLSLAQTKLLVIAFGGDIKSLPLLPELTDPEGVSSYLEGVEVACSTGKKTPKFRVSSGWADVYRFVGVYPPKGNYSWRIHDFQPNQDGNPKWVDSQKFPGNPYFYLYVECVGDGLGNPSPYTGLVLSTFMNYKVQVSPAGQPNWTTIKSGPHAGKYTKTGKQFALFVEIVAPSWFKGVSVSDPHNILPELLQTTKQDNVVFTAFATVNEKGYWTLMHDTAVSLSSTPLPPTADKKVDSPSPSSQEVNPVPFTRRAVELLSEVEGVLSPFIGGDTLDVTPEGGAVLKKYLTPAKEKGIITGDRLEAISLDQIKTFLEQLPEGILSVDQSKALAVLLTEIRQHLSGKEIDVIKDGPLF